MCIRDRYVSRRQLTLMFTIIYMSVVEINIKTLFNFAQDLSATLRKYTPLFFNLFFFSNFHSDPYLLSAQSDLLIVPNN